MRKKILLISAISLGMFLASGAAGLNFNQSVSIAIFSLSILGTLFFWNLRLTFAFLGTSVLLITKTIDIEHVIKYASLEVILFLIGMMILVGLMKDTGFFAWLVSLMLRIKRMTATKFLLMIAAISALLSCAVDEVTSIIFIVAAVLEICDYFEVDATPFLIISVLATNIGSSGTVLGNPIGVLIATKGGLTFEDFITHAFPLMVLCLVAAVIILRLWYRDSLRKLDSRIKEFGANDILIQLISVPPDKELKKSLAVFAATMFMIALHHRIELALGLPANTILLTIPLISSGLVMAWKWRKARDYVEKDVEWWTLLFFLLLFAQAGTLQFTGATDIFARKLASIAGHSVNALIGIVLWVSTVGSSLLDNVVLVAAFVPIVQSFQVYDINLRPLWWALLFGGCLGGNITLIGSTANIVALGILEKEKKIHLAFFKWLWVGLTVGLTTALIVWGALIWLPFYR